MIKETIIVPKGIRYISEWREQYGYVLPDYPCIVNKQITGCGFTEECIRNNENIVLCSPRRILLDNKSQQHPEEVFVVRNDHEQVVNVDKDLNILDKSSINEEIIYDDGSLSTYHVDLITSIKNYILDCKAIGKPCKILVTYDSFRLVKEAVIRANETESFRIVIDEFQSIFTDSKFKSDTELGFLHHLRDIPRRCFVSATPMIDSYLEELDDFKNLQYLEYDWSTEDPNRIMKPELRVRSMTGTSLMTVASGIIKEYLVGNYESVILRNLETGELEKIESKELIIYVNSVKNICDIIRKANLSPDQVNILCSDTPQNLSKIQKSLKSKLYTIGNVTLPGETNKMFTICTRTVYLGADFYSTNARSVILSDANIECLAVDITLDLPQILGRQRLECNPWKNRAEIYVKLLTANNKITQEEFNMIIERKKKDTESLLEIYNNLDESDHNRKALAKKYLIDVKNSNYKNDYVAVNTHTKGCLDPVPNKLAMLSEKRAFEIQQLDYADRFSMFNMIHQEDFITDQAISSFLSDFYRLQNFPERMELLCRHSQTLSEIDLGIIFKQIPPEYSKYFIVLGPDKIKACGGFERNKIDKAYNKVMFDTTSMIDDIYSVFNEGDRLSVQEIVNKLQLIYDHYGNPNRPKGVDIKDYFQTSETKITLSDKSLARGFKLIKKLY